MMQHLDPSVRHRHRHRGGYAALILSGNYREIGDTGHWKVEEGDIIYHRPFESHANEILTACTVVNIPVPPFIRLPSVFRIACSEDLLKAANQGWPGISELLVPHEVKQPRIEDWCDRLAVDLQEKPIRLRNWCAENGVRFETLSRRFKRIYGVLPSKYRIEAQTRHALDLIFGHSGCLTEIALMAGFSDHAHMSRAVKSLTGKSPAVWRNVKSIQEISSCVA